jgi:ParB-like chromosome segregation protein Spo0J
VPGVQTAADPERDIDLAELSDGLTALRLCDASALEAMRRSLERYGQLSAIHLFAEAEKLEILDGFKRVRAARALGLRTLRARVADVDVIGAKVQIAALHQQHGLTELEEGWLIRSLYREHGLSQPVIAARLGRHKTWVLRRLLLVEALEPAVQANVRLGLLAPRAAVVVSQLPRGNQHDFAGLVARRGLTVRQTELLVAALAALADDTARAAQIARWSHHGLATDDKPSERAPRAARSEIDAIATDLRALRLAATRLQTRLSSGALVALGADAARVAGESLLALVPVLFALVGTITHVCDANTTPPPDKDAA